MGALLQADNRAVLQADMGALLQADIWAVLQADMGVLLQADVGAVLQADMETDFRFRFRLVVEFEPLLSPCT
jgi:hypothetical protein